MSKSRNPEELQQDIQWKVEEFYFGNASTPSWAIYRTFGERIQVRDEISLPLSLREGTSQYEAKTDEVAEFIDEHEDCQFLVADSYELTSGGRQQPSLWLIGWQELPEDERHIYEQDKNDGM